MLFLEGLDPCRKVLESVKEEAQDMVRVLDYLA